MGIEVREREGYRGQKERGIEARKREGKRWSGRKGNNFKHLPYLWLYFDFAFAN